SAVRLTSRASRSKSRKPNSCSMAPIRLDIAAGVMLRRAAVARKLRSSDSQITVSRKRIFMDGQVPSHFSHPRVFLAVPYCASGNQIRPFLLRHLRDENKQIVIFHLTNDRAGRNRPRQINLPRERELSWWRQKHHPA